MGWGYWFFGKRQEQSMHLNAYPNLTKPDLYHCTTQVYFAAIAVSTYKLVSGQVVT